MLKARALRPASLAATLLASFAATAMAATPVDGGRYVGTSSQGQQVHFTVSKTGLHVNGYWFYAKTVCQRNGKNTNGTAFLSTGRGKPDITGGSFTENRTFPGEQILQSPRGNVIKGSWHDKVGGQFVTHRFVKGWFNLRFRSNDGSTSCESGFITYTAKA
jgi:hypothetical protein